MWRSFSKATCGVLVASVLSLSFQAARAGLIGADQAQAGTPDPDRVLVLAALDRGDVIAQLQAAGVDPLAARERVRAMGDQEVHALAQDLRSAPAGGVSTWGWVAIVLVAAILWYYAVRK